MTSTELVSLVGAFFSGMGLITAAFFKGFSLLNTVGKKVEDTSEVQVDKLEDLRKEMKLEMASIHNEVSIVVAKLNWTANAPEKTKKVMEAALDKMRDLNASQKEWLTSEMVRITEKKKGD